MIKGLPFGIAVFSAIVLASSLQAAAKDNDLFGRWEREGHIPGWIGFQWIEFTAKSLRSDLFPEMRIERYAVTDEMARVHTQFGETYVFERDGADRLCLSAAKVHALTEPDAIARQQDRLCYVRA